MKGYMYYRKGWGAGAGRSRVLLAPWGRLRKKTGAGAAPKKKLEPEPPKFCGSGSFINQEEN